MSEDKINKPESLSPVVIIGAAGAMGGWFGEMLSEREIRVCAIDIETGEEERAKLLKAANVVIISVPISTTPRVIEETVSCLNESALLVDLTSVKERAFEKMMLHRGEVLSLHPMCAPNAQGLQGQPVVNCGGRDGAKGKLFCQLLEDLGARLISISATKHDQLMAVVQGLNHFNSIAFAHALGKIGIPVEEMIEVASPVYELRMQLMGRILAQEPRLYVDIELENPYVLPVLEHFRGAIDTFYSAIESNSIERCLDFFAKASEYFGPYRETALNESNKVFELRAKESKLPPN